MDSQSLVFAVQFILGLGLFLYVILRPPERTSASFWRASFVFFAGSIAGINVGGVLNDNPDPGSPAYGVLFILWLLPSLIGAIWLVVAVIQASMSRPWRNEPVNTEALFDPLLATVPVVYAWCWLGVCDIFYRIAVGPNFATPSASSIWIPLASVGAFIATGYFLIPQKETDLLYLRSFEYEELSRSLRKDILKGLRGRYRLSGIRNPSKRTWFVVRAFLVVYFMIRYRTSGVFDLEADRGWRVALWRSLREKIIAVFVDLRSITDGLRFEVELCWKVLGPGNIVFVGNSSRSMEEWKALIISEFNIPNSQSSFVCLIWGADPKQRAIFRTEVSELRFNIEDHSQLADAAYEAVSPYAISERARTVSSLLDLFTVFVGMALLVLLSIAVVLVNLELTNPL